MRQIRGSRSGHRPAVALYRDDIESIITVIGAGGEKVSIADGDYEYESIDELITHRGTRPKRLKLSGVSFSSVTVEVSRLNTMGCWLHASGEPTSEIAFFQLRELLDSRRTVLARLLIPKFWLGMTLVSLGAGMLSTQTNSEIRLTIDRLAVTTLLLSFALTMLSMFVSSGLFSTVNLARRHEATTFWSRNGEKLLIAVVAALFGGLIKYLFDRF